MKDQGSLIGRSGCCQTWDFTTQERGGRKSITKSPMIALFTTPLIADTNT